MHVLWHPGPPQAWYLVPPQKHTNQRPPQKVYLDVWRSCKQQKGRKIEWILHVYLGIWDFQTPPSNENEGRPVLKLCHLPGRGLHSLSLPSWLEWRPAGRSLGATKLHCHKTPPDSQGKDTPKMFCFADHEAPFVEQIHEAFGNMWDASHLDRSVDVRERCNEISLYKMDMCFYMA